MEIVEIAGKKVLVVPEGREVEAVDFTDGSSVLFVDVSDEVYAKVLLAAVEDNITVEEFVQRAVEKFVDNGSFLDSIHEKLRSINIHCVNGNLIDCAKAINSLRKDIKVARDSCKGNRRYAFGCIYDALTFTPVEDLTCEAVVNLWLAVSLVFGLNDILNRDYNFIADLIWEKFEMLPQDAFDENTTRLTADMLTEGDFNFEMD